MYPFWLSNICMEEWIVTTTPPIVWCHWHMINQSDCWFQIATTVSAKSCGTPIKFGFLIIVGSFGGGLQRQIQCILIALGRLGNKASTLHGNWQDVWWVLIRKQNLWKNSNWNTHKNFQTNITSLHCTNSSLESCFHGPLAFWASCCNSAVSRSVICEIGAGVATLVLASAEEENNLLTTNAILRENVCKRSASGERLMSRFKVRTVSKCACVVKLTLR